MSGRSKYRLFLCVVLVMSLAGIYYVSKDYIDNKMPSQINVLSNDSTEIDLGIPFTGEITKVADNDSGNVLSVNFSDKVRIITGEADRYNISFKLFGIFAVKNVELDVLDSTQVIPCGMPVGLYLKTNGILIVDIGEYIGDDGINKSPCQGILEKGDYICKANGIDVTSKNEFVDYINNNKSEEMTLTISRNGELIDVKLIPQKDQNNEYKIGAWIKDDTQGIGTLTYIKGDGSYGALGHGINDSETGELMGISGGILYNANVVNIIKGQSGTPGEYVGTIDYNNKNKIGSISSNTAHGIFGELNSSAIDKYIANYGLEPIKIGYKYDAHVGEAYIQTCIDGQIKRYQVSITNVDSTEGSLKSMEFQVTDHELLDKTNGIVQGMSGSPIIQNDKLIGAVTHVFVNNPECGYGIFAECMMGMIE